MTTSAKQRVCLSITGAVQGVGFRPFLFRLADELALSGFVRNTPGGVVIEAEGSEAVLKTLLRRIPREKPPHSVIQTYQYVYLEAKGYADFRIIESSRGEAKTAVCLPDIATCPDCLRDVFEEGNRRYRYPFTNCTHCGPRYSIIDALPYDRKNTSMARFKMCAACRAEYENPADRRFHAQPNACPECGPHVELWDREGNILGRLHEAILEAVAALRRGKIVAVKGLGGFHLMVNASDNDAVRRLRQRKHREEKPFAVMFPSMESFEDRCDVAELERQMLGSGESPIVLCQKKGKPSGAARIAAEVAPGNPYLGAMLPYSPLHHILMREMNGAVVATSGNLSEEPICIDEKEALERLAGIADVFLAHNRPIVRSIDDSVAKVVMDRPMLIRRARGYAPLPVSAPIEGASVLATGGHLKNTVAVSAGGSVFVSQHIGDLQARPSLAAFEQTIASLQALYETEPEAIVCDLHPDYLSTKFAEGAGRPVVRMQHHHAHIVSCMAENRLQGTVLGIVWDGAGYGCDGTVWGGEFLRADAGQFTRAATIKPFLLPGGGQAAVEPRRSAIAVLYALTGGRLESYADLPSIRAFSGNDLAMIIKMLENRIHSPVTTSVGRLFDAAASLLDIKQTLRFEGQAAMNLEYACADTASNEVYPFDVEKDDQLGFVLDWSEMFRAMIGDIRQKRHVAVMAATFHNTLVEMAVDAAKRIGEPRVVLSGGCFQNTYLCERMIARLREEGLKVYWHQSVPPNDGGIALGQAVYAVHQMTKKNKPCVSAAK